MYFDNYSRVRPNVHLEFLANREESRHLDDNRHDYGNLCLLKLLGFTARELSDLGKATAHSDEHAEFENYLARLDDLDQVGSGYQQSAQVAPAAGSR